MPHAPHLIWGHDERSLYGARKDFRENLFSVFIDNINPQTDIECLWGVLKVFGRVRDIYLSPKHNFRRSRFTFIRFETKEESEKVADAVKGMHVYGWPLSAKLVKHNWTSQRSEAKQGARPLQEKHIGRGRAECLLSEVSQNHSFVEVVRGTRFVGKAERKNALLTMSWKRQALDWLSRCAIGSLKEFSLVSNVNKRLKNRDFSFSSHYVGDRNILWCFDSEVEKEGFIRNRFFRDDCFTRMDNWSEKWTLKGKLVCETVSRIRHDKGKLLLDISQTCNGFRDIQVETEEKSFTVKLEIDTTPVSWTWLNRSLDLEKYILQEDRTASSENRHLSLDFNFQEHRFSDKTNL
ncbi:hypothetical protein Dsin_019894 [Dipteronia sinensis]|uniref:RRM domain-containing protein n=1 Tax=Dipteronia sinensis TaxID=43782 RepID=A0AAE0A9G6_9ROSI|nr:hypothetical protein Dsin_019894 [Dipteronia sinensis]